MADSPLRHARRSKGLTQADVAALAVVRRETVSRAECHPETISAVTWERLARGLRVSLGSLLAQDRAR